VVDVVLPWGGAHPHDGRVYFARRWSECSYRAVGRMRSRIPYSGLQLKREKACKVWMQCLSSAGCALFRMSMVSKEEVRAYAVLDVRQKSGAPACHSGSRGTPPLWCRGLLSVSRRARHTARVGARRAADSGNKTVQR